MNDDIQILDDIYDPFQTLIIAQIICQIAPILLFGILTVLSIKYLIDLFIVLSIIVSITISWFFFCFISIKYIIRALSFSNNRKDLFKIICDKKLIFTNNKFSRLFFISKRDNKEIECLLSDERYRRESKVIKIKHPILLYLIMLCASLFILSYILDFKITTKLDNYRYWLYLILGIFGLIYSSVRLFKRSPLIIIDIDGIILHDKEIIKWDKIKDCKIIREGYGRYYTKYIVFQHLSFYLGKDTLISEKVNINDTMISTRKINYYLELNKNNYLL